MTNSPLTRSLLGAALLAAGSAPLAAQAISTVPMRVAEASPGTIRTLSEAFTKALAASETIAISEQSIRQAEALFRKALGASFPSISIRSNTFWQDEVRGRSETDAGLRLSQTNLTGYRELFAVKAAKATQRQKEFDIARAEQLLFLTVATAYYGLIQARDNVTTTTQLKEFSDRRVKELKERVRVGRNREADTVTQEVQIASLDSQSEESRRQAGAFTDLLLYLTKAQAVEPDASEFSSAFDKTIDAYAARIEKRPDVASARMAADAAADAVHVARADRFPQIGMTGNAYRYRPMTREKIDWDATLTVTLPVWTWGSLWASVDSAKTFSVAQDLALQSVRRQADVDVKNAYRDFASARAQFEIQKRAVDLARRAYDLQRHDESRSLVTNIEVLDSLDRLNSTRLAFNRALFNARLSALTLELSAGARPQEINAR